MLRWIKENYFSIFRKMPIQLWIILTITFIGIIIIPMSYYINFYIWHDYVISNLTSDWAGFGEFIGGILNPLLSFMAFVAVLITVQLQITEIRESRQEAYSTGLELQRQTKNLEDQLKEQRRNNNIQTLQNSIFQTLRVRTDIISSYQSSHLAGMQSIQETLKKFQQNFENLTKSGSYDYTQDLISQANSLKRYFSWFTLFYFLCNSDIVDKDDPFLKETINFIKNGITQIELFAIDKFIQRRTDIFPLVFSDTDIDALNWIINHK